MTTAKNNNNSYRATEGIGWNKMGEMGLDTLLGFIQNEGDSNDYVWYHHSSHLYIYHHPSNTGWRLQATSLRAIRTVRSILQNEIKLR